jgi:hypothetical protein
MMTVRKRAPISPIEALAGAVPDTFLDLRPFLADGVAGLRRYTQELTRWLESNGSNVDALHDVLDCLGVEISECYRVMLSS